MRLGTVLAAVVLMASCSVELMIPAGAGLACRADTDCPDGYACSSSLGLCVTSELGSEALSPTVEPEWAGGATVVRVEFTTAGELRSMPVVELQTTPARPLQYVELVGDRYAFSYTAVGDETEGAFAITATLVSRGGSVTSPLGQVTFDFTAPTGSGGRAGDTFGSGDTLAQSLGVSEPLGQHPSIVIASSPAVSLVLVSHDGTSYGFERAFDGSEPEGTFSILATLRDRAGNEGTADLGTVTVTHP